MVFFNVDLLTEADAQKKDRERATYGVKEAGIAKAYIGALGLDRHSRDAVRMLKWKQPTKDNVCISLRFGATIGS